MKTKLIHACMFTPRSDGGWGLPLVLIGKPGVAKSSTFRALAKSMGVHCEILAVGERGEGAFGVTPVPVENGETFLDYPAPSWVKSLRNANGEQVGIVLVDEYNTAPPALQPALLGLMLDKRIGGNELGPRVRVFGAMNPVGHAAAGWDESAPSANRHGHLPWDGPDAQAFSSWLVGDQDDMQPIDIDEEETRVLAEWPAAKAWAFGVVAAFVQCRPELLHKQPADGDPAASGPWPSPITWEFAARALATSRVHNLTEVETDELISSFVGADAAAELVAWIENQDLPNPADLLDGNVTWAHDVARLDRTLAVLSSCVALVTPKDAVKRNDRGEALWKILATLLSDAKDLAVPAATSLARARVRTATYKTVMTKLHDVHQAAKSEVLK